MVIHLVDCVWSPFGNWSECSKSCGGGSKVAERTVETKAIGGGKACEGDSRKIKLCNEQPCPGMDIISINISRNHSE